MQNSESNQSAFSSDTASGNGATSGAESTKVARPRKSRATGPRTPQGKERSKRNALKHAIFSQVALLKGESRAEYHALLNGFRESLQPEGELEEWLIEKLALCAWRQRRLIIAETAEIRRATEFLACEANQQQTERSNNISEYSIRYESGLIRRIANSEALDRCLELLKELRDEIEDNGLLVKRKEGNLTKLFEKPPVKNGSERSSICTKLGGQLLNVRR